jgi:hypothetical protein
MDKSAIVIVIFYDICFFIKFLAVILFKYLNSEISWTPLVTYFAISGIWVLLYYFTFEMKRV